MQRNEKDILETTYTQSSNIYKNQQRLKRLIYCDDKALNDPTCLQLWDRRVAKVWGTNTQDMRGTVEKHQGLKPTSKGLKSS